MTSITSQTAAGQSKVEEGGAAAEVLYNQNALITEAGATRFRVLDHDLTAPPGSPSDQDAYIVAAGGTGDWLNKDDSIAIYSADSVKWLFATPQEDWRAWVDDEASYKRYSGSAWVLDGTSSADAYGEMYVHDNSGGSAQTIGTSFAKITQWVTAGASFNTTVDPTTDDDITVDVDGTFEVFVSMSFSGTGNTDFTLAVAKNGTEQNNTRCERKLGSGGDVGVVSISGLVTCAATDTLTISVKADGASKSFLVHEANITVMKL